MKRTLLFVFLLMVAWATGNTQRTIVGRILDPQSQPLIGVTVLVEGTNNGTVTDYDGAFTLVNVAEDAKLNVSYTGYITTTVSASSFLTSPELIMAEDYQLLNEVVVSALGVERNARNVVYANQTVKSDDLLSTPNKNTLDALRGKAAGVRITTGSGSVGATSKIILRSEGSLTGNNEALIVIDGVPVDNDASYSGPADATGYADYGNRFNDFNPGDIESVTILKGPAATSLYGSRGASGVVLITTKQGGGGKGDQVTVGINSSYSVENVNMVLERQDQFGQGYDNSVFDSGENFSWGPPLDGVIRPWTSPVDVDGDGALEVLTRPYSNVNDQLLGLFNTGSTSNNSFYVSGGKGGFTFYASYGNVFQKGVLDNTNYNRNSIAFNSSAQLSQKLTARFGLDYSHINLNTLDEDSYSFTGRNAYANALQTPVNIPISELRDYKSPYHDFYGYYGSYSANPFFILNEFQNNGKIQNVLGNFSLTYNLAKGLDITGQVGTNIINRNIETSIPKYEYAPHLIWGNDYSLSLRGGRPLNIGEYTHLNGTNTNINGKLFGQYTTQLSENLSLTAIAGTDIFDRRTQFVQGETVGGLVVDGWYNLSNSVQNAKATEYASKYRIVGLLGNINVGYKNQLFLDYSARNDWSSTLPEENNSYFYQAIGVSAIMSDILGWQDSRLLNFAKLRGSYGTTGKDAPIYRLQSTFEGNPVIMELNNHTLTTPINGQPAFVTGDLVGNPNLRPELTTTYEIGADLGFFKNVINIEYTYYHSLHSNQIVEVSLPRSTGYLTTYGNIGELENKGHELHLNIKPLGTSARDFTWDLDFTYAKNHSEVLKVSDEQDELIIGGYSSAVQVAKVGYPFGVFKATVVQTDPEGHPVVSSQGQPVIADDPEYINSFQPDYLGSFGTTVGWKGIHFSILFEGRKGGNFFSLTKSYTEFNGTALSTLVGNREEYIIPGSVILNDDGTYSPNETPTTAQEVYANSNVPFGGKDLLIDASFLKLREVTLSYDLSRLMHKNNNVLKGATLGIFGNNLKYWLPKENTYADPEINGFIRNTGSYSGIENSQIPSSRSVGIRLNLIF